MFHISPIIHFSKLIVSVLNFNQILCDSENVTGRQEYGHNFRITRCEKDNASHWMELFTFHSSVRVWHIYGFKNVLHIYCTHYFLFVNFGSTAVY